jgi:signal transduction histidine kinase
MRADGSEFPVELTITRIGLSGPPMFSGSLRDITARQRGVAELRASRARILEAADTARRRLERDLHDGAQQRLVGLALTLRLATDALETDAGEARRLLGVASQELAAAIGELREFARGIHPQILSDGGLAPALNALVRRFPVVVDIDDVPRERLGPAVEATAYFFVAEALTNVTRYADASRARVRVTLQDGHLDVEVADDGRGGADPAGGSGLRGLADRVAALSGEIDLDSPPGKGTTVRARIPVGV